MCPEIRTRFVRAVMRYLIATSIVASIAVPAAAQTLAAGEHHSIILKSDGTVWGSGYNGVGGVGDGTWTDRKIPVQVNSLSDVVAVAAGLSDSPKLLPRFDAKLVD